MPATLGPPLGEVFFEETGEIRKVVGVCKTCLHSSPRLSMRSIADVQIVSPGGVAHVQHWDGYEMTACGRDASRGDWWWKL